MKVRTVHLVAGALAVAAPGLVAPATASERVGYTEIAAGRLADAEAVLTEQSAIHPRSPELMLNLAAVYARTHRAEQARPLYDQVLRSRSVLLDMPGGDVVSSHEVARRGLARLGVTLATR